MNVKYKLSDTVEWMLSDDYRVRLKGEYWQIVIRLEELRRYLHENFIRNGREEYFHLMLEQFGLMKDYKRILEKRCHGLIDLDNDDVSFL